VTKVQVFTRKADSEIAGLNNRISELEKENKELQECFDECYEELQLTRNDGDKRIAELEEVINLVHKDLLLRAEVDDSGCKVVDLSSSIWIKLSKTKGGAE
jgi:predicted nuclease with TOPRIM domain